jgi:hypothetical protein
LKATILANQTSGGNCFINTGSGASAGYNLSDDGSCGFLNQTGDQNNVTTAALDPGGLKNNGGPTQTIALLAGSSVIDAIPLSACSDISGNLITTDQRGITRPQGSGCDIGAFEITQPPVANVCSPGQNTPAPCSATITLQYNIPAGTTFGANPVQVVTQGAPNRDFTLASTTCTGSPSNCSVVVTFAPLAPGLRLGGISLTDASGNPVASSLISGTGDGPAVAFGPGLQTIAATGIVNADGVAEDASGNLFAVDSANNLILKVPAGCSSVTCQITIASGLNSPDELAMDGFGNLFVSQSSNSVVEIPAGCGSTSCQIPLGSGFNQPYGVAVDGDGNVFVSDSGNNRIVEISAAGAQTTIASLSDPTFVTLDGAGNLFVLQTQSGGVMKFPSLGNGAFGAPIPLGGGWVNPVGLAVDAAGNVFVADQGFSYVVELPTGCVSGACQTTIGSGLALPTGIAIDPTGDIFVPQLFAGNVVEINRSQPPMLSFASTTVGSTSSDSPQAVTIQNIGNQPLNAVSPGLAVTGPNFLQVAGPGTFPDCAANFSLTSGALCNLSLSFQPQSAGALSSTAVFTDNALNASAAVQSIALSGSGTQTTTLTGLVSSLNPSAYGQSVYFTATVTPTTATGTVQFQIDNVNFGAAVPLSGGQAISGTISTLSVGQHSIAAIYSGDKADLPSSGGLTQNVSDAGSTVGVSLTAGANPSTYATQLTFTATVGGQYGQIVQRGQGARPRVVTGSVSWSGNTGCPPSPISAGVATCTTQTLPGGPQTVTATYGGDGNHNGGSGTLAQTVNPQVPAVAVTLVNPSSEPFGAGTPVTVTGTLNWTGDGEPPLSGVKFSSTAAGTFAGSPTCFSSGPVTTTCTQVFTPSTADAAGTYTMSAAFTTDGNYASASSTQTNNFTITFTMITPTVALQVLAPNSEPYGGSLGAVVTASISWTGSGPAPTSKGPVLTFSSNAVGSFGPIVCVGKTSPIVCGTVFLPVVNDPVGVYTVTANYGGDSHFTPAGSPQTNNFSITADVPLVKLTPNPVSVKHGSAWTVTVTATFTGAGSHDAAPSGAVTFSAPTGSFLAQSCTASGDTLTCTANYAPTGKLAVGTYKNYISASIAAAGDYAAASGSVNLTVTK